MPSATPETPSALVMQAMEIVGSSDTLARLMNTTSNQVIRWMIGREPVPGTAIEALQRLLNLPTEELARELHITREELDLRRRAPRSDTPGPKDPKA